MDGMVNRCGAVTSPSRDGLFLGLLLLILCGTAAMRAIARGGTLRIGMTAAAFGEYHDLHQSRSGSPHRSG
jgi:hypothetical protein